MRENFLFVGKLDHVVDRDLRKWSLLLNGFMPPLGHGKDKYTNSFL